MPGEPQATAASPAAASPTAASYSESQAERGRRVFDAACSACHARNQFSGTIFQLTWMAEPVGHLFEWISTAMPQDDPGSRTPEEYAAVVAYLMQLNGVAAGTVELPADAERLSTLRWPRAP